MFKRDSDFEYDSGQDKHPHQQRLPKVMLFKVVCNTSQYSVTTVTSTVVLSRHSMAILVQSSGRTCVHEHSSVLFAQIEAFFGLSGRTYKSQEFFWEGPEKVSETLGKLL